MSERRCKAEDCCRVLSAGDGDYCPYHEQERTKKVATWLSGLVTVAGVVVAVVLKAPWPSKE